MILSLETSTRVCSVAIHDQGVLIADQSYHLQKSHSELLPNLIFQLMGNIGLAKKDIQAISISAGPGSYTGLRIGTSCAKGLAFSWDVPIVALDSLEVLMEPVRHTISEGVILMPMLDARRNEVYTFAFDTRSEKHIWKTQPLVLDNNSLEVFRERKVVVFGDGADKAEEILEHPQLLFLKSQYPYARNMGKLAWELYQENRVVDIAYFEPEYLKPYHTNKPKKLIS
jgi:tRNA threonylcarbamoyladenosine biosynthesis protein TsaB